jgi:hypothetical protein
MSGCSGAPGSLPCWIYAEWVRRCCFIAQKQSSMAGSTSGCCRRALALALACALYALIVASKRHGGTPSSAEYLCLPGAWRAALCGGRNRLDIAQRYGCVLRAACALFLITCSREYRDAVSCYLYVSLVARGYGFCCGDTAACAKLLTVACEAMGIAIANAFKDGVRASLTKVGQSPWRYWNPGAWRRIAIGKALAIVITRAWVAVCFVDARSVVACMGQLAHG